MIRKILALGLAAALFAPGAFAGALENCSDAVFRGDGTADTTILSTTAAPLVFLTADQTEDSDPLGGWAGGDADFAEWCWTAPENVESSTFKVRWYVDSTQGGTTQGVAVTIGKDVDATIAAGDEISEAVFHEFTAAADRTNLVGFGITSISDGGCIGLLADADAGTPTITVTSFHVEVEEVGCNE